MKNQRQQKILEIIEKYDISTQEDLIAKLEEFGFSVTQTTISRDIHQLKLVKGLSQGGIYKYIIPTSRVADGRPVFNAAISAAVISVESAQNLVVLKTTPGMANAVAISIEMLELPRIVGSVAGDDTLLLVFKDSSAAEEAEYKLRHTFTV